MAKMMKLHSRTVVRFSIKKSWLEVKAGSRCSRNALRSIKKVLNSNNRFKLTTKIKKTNLITKKGNGFKDPTSLVRNERDLMENSKKYEMKIARANVVLV